MSRTFAVVDTTFANHPMGRAAEEELRTLLAGLRIVRATVPGIKDLPVACKRLLDAGAEIAIACGMPGPEPVDKQSAHVASMGLQWAMLQTGKHIVEVFVHMDEARDAKELTALVENRTREHARNAYWLLCRPEELARRAGTGQRQGFADVGPALEPTREARRAAQGAHASTFEVRTAHAAKGANVVPGGGGSSGGRH